MPVSKPSLPQVHSIQRTPAAAAPLALLGGISPQRFLRHYWQKRPLLIRQAVPAMKALLSPAQLFALAARDEVESRLVQLNRKRWSMQRGPFDTLPRAARDWTLLVQGVNLFDERVDALMRNFDFLPITRLDDLMISYAVDGGSVGPHFDSYDVFLLQAEGERRWRISAQSDLTLVDGVPLKILANFVPEQEWLLAPGDMLYLPPQYAHEGVAVGPCMTYSIGFRAPDHNELAREFLLHMADEIELSGRYRDPGRKPVQRPAQLDDHLLATLQQTLQRVRWTKADIASFAGRYFSEPKAHVLFDPPKAMARSGFLKQAAKSGLRLSPKTQMLYGHKHVYINGEDFDADGTEARWLARLADARRATSAQCAALADLADLADTLHDWHQAGWLLLDASAS